MIVSFKDRGTEDVFLGRDTRDARKACPRLLWPVARRKLDNVNMANRLADLRIPPGNRLEELKGIPRGTYSIRINDQYRICFRWTENGPDQVEIVDYH